MGTLTEGKQGRASRVYRADVANGGPASDTFWLTVPSGWERVIMDVHCSGNGRAQAHPYAGERDDGASKPSPIADSSAVAVWDINRARHIRLEVFDNDTGVYVIFTVCEPRNID